MAAHPPRIIAHPDLQETADNPCDTGSELEELKKRFPQVVWDGEGVEWEGWTGKKGVWGPGREEVEERAVRVRKYLFGLGEVGHVVCVLHGGVRDSSGGDGMVC